MKLTKKTTPLLSATVTLSREDVERLGTTPYRIPPSSFKEVGEEERYYLSLTRREMEILWVFVGGTGGSCNESVRGFTSPFYNEGKNLLGYDPNDYFTLKNKYAVTHLPVVESAPEAMGDYYPNE